MPREFQDFSHEVSQGTDKIVKGLDDVRGAADNADVASGKLSKTQDRGVRSGNSYAKSMAGISKQLSGVSSMAKDVARGFSTTDSSVRSLGSSLSSIRSSAGEATTGLATVLDVSKEVATSLEKISGIKVEANFDIKAAKAARQAIEDVGDAFEKVSNIPPPKPVDFEKLGESLRKIKIDKTVDSITDEINRFKGELVKLEGSVDVLDDLQRSSFLEFSIKLAGAKEFDDFFKTLPQAEQLSLSLTKSSKGLDSAIKELADTNEVFAAKLRLAENSAKDTAEASKTYHIEVEKATGLLGKFNEKLEEGSGEAKSFAGGLGVGNGMAIAAGVAVFFLATKVSDLIDEWKDSAVELANFNTKLAALEGRAQALGFEGSFDSLRNELNLTRAQADKFFDVLEDGVSSGVASVAQLQQAALQLTATFGGDQTARLEEYVSLLKDIPTLDTDLSITASLDDQADAAFALAKAGKFSTVIDLQAAGLAGGIQIDALSAEDKELIDASQKTEKSIEDIQDTLLGFFPSWGPQFSAGVAGITKVVAGIGAVVAGLGVLSALGGSQIVAQGTTTAAVLATGGIDAASDVGKSISKTATPGIMKGLKSILPKILGGGATAIGAGATGAAPAVGALASNPVGWAVAIGLAVAAISAGAFWAGGKLNDFGDDLIEDGNKISGGFAKMYGATLKAQAGLLLLGPLGFAAVLATGGLEDYLSGVESVGQGLQEQIGGINKYNGVISGAGSLIEAGAKGVRDGFNWAKDGIVGFVKEVPGVVSELSNMASELTGGIIPSFEQLEHKVKSLVFSQEYLKEQKRLAPQLAKINARLEQVANTSERYDKALQEFQKGQQISGLALQKQLEATKNALESGKIAILDFRNEVKNLQLDNLTELGGTAEGFDHALKQASDSVTSRFEKVSDVLVKRRSDILKDSKLNATARRDALLDLKKQELEATRVFVDGITKVIGALLKTPQIVQAGLQGAFSKAKFDFKVEEGVGDFQGDFQNQIKEFSTQLTEAVGGWEKTTGKLAEAEKKFNETRAKGLATVADDVSKLSAGGQAKLEGVDFKDQKAVRESFDKIQKEFQETEDKIDGITTKLSPKSFTALSTQLQKAETDLKTWGKATKAAQEEFEDLSKELAEDPGDLELAKEVKDAKATLDENMKLLTDAKKSEADALDGLYENFGKELVKSSGKSADEVKVALKLASEGLSKGLDTEDIMANADDGALVNDALELISKNETKKEKVIKGQLKTLQKQNNAQSEALGVLDVFVSGENIVNKLLETRNASFEELLSIANQSKDIAEGFVKSTEAITVTERKELDIIKSRQSLALLTNSTTENLLAEQQKQNQISQKTISEVDKQIANAKALGDALRAQAKAAKTEDAKDIFNKSAKVYDNAIVQLNQKRGEAVAALGRVGDAMAEGIDRFNESVSGRRIQQEFDLSDTLSELASFSNDYANIIGQSTDIAIASAKRKAREERKILAETSSQEESNLQTKFDSGIIGKKEFQEGKSLLIAKKKTREADIELRQKQKVVDAAAREASLKLEAIGLDEELINAQMDFLSEVGGSFSSILKLQNAGVQIERDKLAVLEEERQALIDGKITGIKLTKAENAVKIQGLKVRKAEFGIQKDIFEKLIGKAFGEIRTDLGAARRRGSDVGVMGRGRTRVAGRNGLFLKGGAEAGKSIDERRADRVLGKLAGLGGKKDGAGKGEEEGEGPKRLDIESQMANFKSNKETAKATSDLAKAGLERGSIFTHDVTTEDLLKQISGNTGTLVSGNEALQSVIMDGIKFDKSKFVEGAQTQALEFEKEMAGSAKKDLTAQEKLNKIIESEDSIRNAEMMNPFAGNEMLADPDFRRTLSGKPSAEQIALEKEVAEEVKKNREADRANVDDVTKNTPAEAVASKAPATNVSVVPEKTDEMSKKHQANMEDVGNVDIPDEVINKQGAGTATQAAMTVSIQGQVSVKLDSKLLQVEMATWVAQVINTSEVRAELDKRYLTSAK